MPFELFPASRSTDRGKRKRENDADLNSAAENQKKPAADEEEEANATTDQEVDEFFAILKRLHSATKSIEKIDGASSLLMAKRSKAAAAAATATASEEEADEDEIKAERRNLDLDLRINLDLDLNLEPVSDESDDKQRTSRNLNLKPLLIDSAADSRRK